MWPRQQQTVIQDGFSTRVQRVEADCMRRLDFIEAQLGRVQRPNRRWDSHMTVVDADIEPVGPVTQVLDMVNDVHAWPWWMYVLVGLGFLVLVAMYFAVH